MPNIQFQVRRGTASTWTSTNPTLANGEFGFETDTRQLKIGNNVAWNVLPYLNIGQAANWSAFPAYQTVDMSVNILNNVGSIRNGAGTVSAPSYTFMNDVSMGLYDPSTNVLGIVTSGVERMRVDQSGNVGIGTRAPLFNLDVSGNTRFGTSNSSYGGIGGFVNIDSGALGTTIGMFLNHMAIRSTNGNTDQLRFYSRRDLNAVSGWQSAPLIIQRYVDGTLNPFGFIKFGGSANNQGVSIGSGSTDTLNVTSGGLVGIGTPSPNAKLGISSSSTGLVFDAIKLTTTGPVANSTHRIGISNYANYGSVIDFIEESSANFNSIMSLKVSDNGTLKEGIRIFASGNVAIRSTDQNWPLTVGPGNSYTADPSARWFDVNTNLTSGLVTQEISIYSERAVLSSRGFYAISDERIKTNLQDIPDGESLQQLRLIEPTSYEYIDKIEKGNQRVYGFMAQQVREIIPHAVTLQKHIVPDIYDLADVCGTTVTLRTKTFTYSDISATINMILQETGKQDVSANFYPPNTIELHQPFQQDVSQAFVYGRKVDDFHTLDKDVIFTINVAATQELDRQLQAAKDKIQSLENRLSMLENR